MNLLRHGRRTCHARAPALRGLRAAAHVPVGRRVVSRALAAPSSALVGIAAVWGLTFVMVQDAIERLPTMAFLGYRFVRRRPRWWRVVFRRAAARARPRRAGAPGLVMGAFLTAGYVLPDAGPASTPAPPTPASSPACSWSSRPCSAPLVLRQRIGRRGLGRGGRFGCSGCSCCPGWAASCDLRGDGLVPLCAVAFAAHILVTDRAVADHDIGALLAVQLGVVRPGLPGRGAAIAGDLEVPRGTQVWVALVVTSLVASALGFFVQSYAQRHASPARTALILAAEPAFAGLFGYLLAGDRLTALGWLGAALIMAAIVAVDAVPRLRPPRPLPEG